MLKASIRLATILVLPIAATAGGCDNEASPSTIPDGVTSISKNMRGIWSAPGGPDCRWSKIAAGGTKTGSGKGNRSQTMIISSSDVGGQVRSTSCAPKGWTK